jgi:flagellar biosynthesis/type III secretory pathway protein FliH
MTNNEPDYRTADELIRECFQDEARDFKEVQEDLMATVEEWVFLAYLQGHEDGFVQGEDAGTYAGYTDGQRDGYDEGYDDARMEFESYD